MPNHQVTVSGHRLGIELDFKYFHNNAIRKDCSDSLNNLLLKPEFPFVCGRQNESHQDLSLPNCFLLVVSV